MICALHSFAADTLVATAAGLIAIATIDRVRVDQHRLDLAGMGLPGVGIGGEHGVAGLGHLPGARRDSAAVRDAVVAALGALPLHLLRTLTWDQGAEMARHAEVEAALGSTPVFFCDPHSPWQRPTNENTNGLLRAYFPKNTDLSVHTPEEIADVQAGLNDRPRRVLGWDSPAERLATLLGPPPALRR